MKSIINDKNIDNHVVEPYRFKVLGGCKVTNVEEEETVVSAPTPVKEEPVQDVPSVVASPIVEEQNGFIEELLKKSDELSSNIIKLQMQIEKQEDDFKNRLQTELTLKAETSFQEGYQKAKEELDQSVSELKQKFLNSINLLDEESKKSGEYLTKIEHQLSDTAIEVAKEVILKELKNSSSDVAIALSKKLIEDLKDAKNVKVKVHPKDYQSLSEVYSSIDNIRVESDTSITEGGVVILSDVGNLDGNISTRLDKVKNLIENG